MNKQSLITILAGLAFLAVLYLIIKPNQTQNFDSPTPTPTSASQSADQASTKIFELKVANNKLISGPETLTVNQGDTVIIRITADVNGELHLHGYNIPVDFKKDTPTDLKVVANIAGRFPYELEDTSTEIGTLQVQPR